MALPESDLLDSGSSCSCWARSGWGNVILSSSTAIADNVCLVLERILGFWCLAFFQIGAHLKFLQKYPPKWMTFFLLFWNVLCQQKWRIFASMLTLKIHLLLQNMITSNNKTKTCGKGSFKMKNPITPLIWLLLFCLLWKNHWDIFQIKIWAEWVDFTCCSGFNSATHWLAYDSTGLHHMLSSCYA